MFLEITSLKNTTDIDLDNLNSAARIFTEYGEFIYKIAIYKVRDKDLADDLCQNFFLSSMLNPIPSSVKNIKSYIIRH